MIKEIRIKDVASYSMSGQTLSDLTKINFFYGSNATGKTTISRVIAEPGEHPNCEVTWQAGTALEAMVYNRDFVDKNFNPTDELKGIFTLGEKDKSILDKIKAAKSDLDSINASIATLKSTLAGDDDNGGKIKELATLESEFEQKCWDLKLKHDSKLQGAFTGVRDKKRKFKAKLLEESTKNTASAVPLVDLEQKAGTVFGEMPQTEQLLTVPNHAGILAYEANPVLKKQVIGKSDVDIAALIQKLGNSDWVKQGREFYDPVERVCPFCQQTTGASLENSLNEYFDEVFGTDTASIEKLYTDYKTDSERLQQSLQELIDNPSKFLDMEKLKAERDLLESKIRLNIQSIEEKRRESSKLIELDSLKNIMVFIKALVDTANTEIQTHNTMVANLETEQTELKAQVWRYLLDHQIKSDLAIYNSTKNGFERAIASLEQQINDKTEDKQEKGKELRTLEKDTTSIQPTIDGINALLESFGFRNFALAKSEHERFYKIQRPDGSDAKETLSEGEKSFITFLYFYHLLKGSESESGMTSDRVVVFDDPVSSLDSDILFVVSNLIKGLFDEVRNQSGTIKQIFIFTHNVYFHKEVSFNPRRSSGHKFNDETFWTVRKVNQESKLQPHDINPIKTSYELLWLEVRNPDRDNLAIQNTLRRILENYFKILGNIDPDEICKHFEGKEKLICKSLFSWVNDGSHSAFESLYVSIDDSIVEIYLNVFEEIFNKTGHGKHYKMMMDGSLPEETHGG